MPQEVFGPCGAVAGDHAGLSYYLFQVEATIEAITEGAQKATKRLACLSNLKAWKVPLKLVLRLPSRVLIQQNCGRSLGCLPPLTTALLCQLAAVTTQMKARPSESIWLPGARCRLAQAAIACELKPLTAVILA
jgi:hypothetical protein